MDSLVLYEVKDRVGYITLNRPEKRNALSSDMVNAIRDRFNVALLDDICKVIVIRANGDVFCSGADLDAIQKLQTNTFDENLADSRNLMQLLKLIYDSSKVVIAQVEGHALAGGCGLATVCDFIFATPSSKFVYTEVKIGFVPAIVMAFLIRKVGENFARYLLLTGEPLTADKAKQAGLISDVADPGTIREEVFEFALKLCTQASGASLKMTRQMIGRVQSLSLDDALDYAAEMNAHARMTEDCRKGIDAFLKREKLTW
jgi:methylglutaconyl-CoA hydratase